MADHDQRFKVLLREFFAEFVRLFFPAWVDRFDFTRAEWLDTEVFLDPPQGERRAVDLLARLPTTRAVQVAQSGEHWLALVHVEVESRDSVEPLRRRMFEYYEHLRRRHGLPVLPIGVYLRVGLDGIGWDSYEEAFWEHRLVRFDYPYVGLPALDAEEYVRQDNWLGVALTTLMRVPPERRVELAAEAVRRLAVAPLDLYRRYLLCECVSAYLPPEEQLRREVESRLLTDPDPGVRTMATSLLDLWRNEGREEGLQQGQREALLLQLEERFKPLPAEIRQRAEALPPDRVKELLLAVARGQSLQEMGLG